MILDFHFLRPWWLLALLPLAGLVWLLVKYRFDLANWREVIDSRLLPFVLTASDASGSRRPLWIFALVGVLAIGALAGPTWEKQPQPVYQSQSALVILLDLSRSMDSVDLKPSRLVRARHKITDILQRRAEGQTALVVYAADAFTVTPLTDDIDTILAMLPSLESNIMPAQGSRIDRALKLAFELMRNSGVVAGDILLVSDGLNQREMDRFELLWDQQTGHRLSVLAVGTQAGGPIPLASGDFLKDRNGSIVIPGLNESGLREAADIGQGIYTLLSSSDQDIDRLTALLESRLDDSATRVADQSAELWRELGPWLILLALPFAALGFRRGLVWTWPLVVLILPPDAEAMEWGDLWRNADQHAGELFVQGEHAEAARQFSDPAWAASAHFRSGDYQSALDLWQGLDDETAHYNRGNALARMGQYTDALGAYEQALQLNPDHADALHNKKQIEEWLKNQQSPESSEQSQQQAGESSGERQEQGQQQNAGDGGQSAEDDLQSAMDETGEAGEEAQQAAEDTERNQADAGQDERVAELEEQMTEQAAQQWLRKIPDDPGGLLRRKFLHQYRQRGGVDTEAQSW